MFNHFSTASAERGRHVQLAINDHPTVDRDIAPNREMARILDIDRGAVNNHVKQLRAGPAVADGSLDQVQNRPGPETCADS